LTAAPAVAPKVADSQPIDGKLVVPEATPERLKLGAELFAANCAAWNAPFAARPSPVWDDVVRRR